MPRAPAAEGGPKQQKKQPQAQNPDPVAPVAPSHTSRSTAAQILPVPGPAPAPRIFPTQNELQAPLNFRPESPGEVFDEISSGTRE